MKKTLQDYFHSEMQLLNEGVRGFSDAFPELADRLRLDSRGDCDPHIARLLEGSAYLHARIKQQIDLGVHHVSEAVIRQFAPQYLSVYPSMTVVEFMPNAHRVTKSQWIPPGVKLVSPAVGDEETVCEFMTTQGLITHPLGLSAVKRDSDGAGRHSLRLSFELTPGALPSDLVLDALPFFINAPLSDACIWYECLTRQVDSIWLKQEGSEPQPMGGQDVLSGMFLSTEESMLPPHLCHYSPFEVLRDYFLFPERFLFVSLAPKPITLHKTTFDVVIQFSCPMPDFQFPADVLKLHCVPAANLFSMHCEPIRYVNTRLEYPLIVCQDKPKSKLLVAIQQVSGIARHTMTRQRLTDFYQLPDQVKTRGQYRISQIQEDEQTHHHRLSFSGISEEALHVSVDAVVCNHLYPRQYLTTRMLYLHDERLGVQYQATNIIRPTKSYQPNLNSQYAAQALRCVYASGKNLIRLSELKPLLSWLDTFQVANELIMAINHLEVEPIHRIAKGTVLVGQRFCLSVISHSDRILSQFTLFGAVLHGFLAAVSPINSTTQLVLTFEPSGKRMVWG